ncbi:MAG: Gldg family protein [Myxococcales bacterium]|nr:Gldg family protein [Myxococcales bacterium]
MRGLALTGVIALSFGLGSFYATGHFGVFSAVNLALGSLALLAATVAGVRRIRRIGGPHSRPVILRGALLIVAAFALALVLEQSATRSRIQFDWTGEGRFELSPATLKACGEFDGELTAALYRSEGDPRTRRTRLLLQRLAQFCPLVVRELLLDESPEDEDRYAIGSSNSVVFAIGDRFETVERPTEGAIYEALYRLRSVSNGVVTVLRGEGQGDPERQDDLGYSGLAVALGTEGYRLQVAVSAAITEIPDDSDAVLLISPRRRMRDSTIDALRRYLAKGGRLVALLEPGVESGVESLLAEYGLEALPSVLVDPASGAVEDAAEGLNIVAYNYAEHPASAGLNQNRMTFFPGVRPIAARATRPGDRVMGVVWSSPHAWATDDLSVLEQRSGRVERRDEPQGYRYIMAAGRYPRDGVETRIVVFGDADFASNRYLRALYDLDILINSVHWVVQRESQITLRPKIRDTVQFPLPMQDTLRTLYGVGLLVPELLLIAGGVVWMRRRAA